MMKMTFPTLFIKGTRVSFIKLNFVSSSSSSGLVLTIIGVFALMIVGLDYIISAREILKIQNLANEYTPDSLPQTELNAEQQNIIYTSLNQLSIPWGILFLAMERAHSDEVKLISLEPDAERRSVRIVAEVEDVYQMLDYIRALEKQPHVSKINLVSQKNIENKNDIYVRFTLEGSWARP